MTKRFLIVDDHSIVRTGIRLVLSEQFFKCIIDEADGGETAVDKVKHNDYDLITLDIHMPETDPTSIIPTILAIKPDSKILIFSMASEDIFAKRYLKMGVMGFLSKDCQEEEIKIAVTQILQKRKYISTDLAIKLSDDSLNSRAENPFDNLSNRELQLAIHLMNGKTLSEIAEMLNIGVSTVGSHKANILVKLKVSNIIELREMAKLYNII